MSRALFDFSAGEAFGRALQKATARGVTAVASGVQRRSSLGMKYAQNSVTRQITGSTGRKTKNPGIEYFVGRGAPAGGYPGKRTGQLEMSLGFEFARPAKRPRAFVTAGGGEKLEQVNYAAAVHKTHPFLTLPLTYSRSFLFAEFEKGFRSAFKVGVV